MVVLEHQEAVLTCVVIGNPSPSVHWVPLPIVTRREVTCSSRFINFHMVREREGGRKNGMVGETRVEGRKWSVGNWQDPDLSPRIHK